ncbi:MAG: 2,3,4,5-tetrahydropyridine-2,6-dicarboxylate N-succinyltransferase [Calditrichaeota bacterium]|nr:2,3,4,5-tetrahydropyridine-2,6-dicarboxylate N-succinyltransferase [Calditrichota bacterium]
MDIAALKGRIEAAYNEASLLNSFETQDAIRETIDLLDRGKLRVAENQQGNWIVHEWLKKAILLYFRIQKMRRMEIGPFEFYDKIPLKSGYERLGVRVVPPGVARYGAYLAPGVILMPGYVNIGAYVDRETMIDTHATVGSCAQVGRRVHISGGVRIGGVLEPPQSRPVIIEDDVFLGSGVSVTEGVIVRQGAVLGAGVIITASTHILDVSASRVVEYRGEVPPRSVVIPGAYPRAFPGGTYSVQCALIIGKRRASTDAKTSLNEVLRQFNISV